VEAVGNGSDKPKPRYFVVILELILFATPFISRSYGPELAPNIAKPRRPSDE